MRVLCDDDGADIEIQRFQRVDDTEQFLIIGNAGITAELGVFNVVGIDTDYQLDLVFQLCKKTNLVVRLIAGKHTGRMEVFKHLSAEFQIKLSVKHLDSLEDLVSLKLQILL